MATRIEAAKVKPTKLSARELQIATLVVEGHSSAEIGKLLSIVAHTVKFHLYSIYQITGFTSRAKFIVNFYKTGSYYRQQQQEGELCQREKENQL